MVNLVVTQLLIAYFCLPLVKLFSSLECRGSKRPLETVTPDNTEFLAEGN